jgi:hypothetical protein
MPQRTEGTERALVVQGASATARGAGRPLYGDAGWQMDRLVQLRGY